MTERGWHGRFTGPDYTGMRSGKLTALKRIGRRGKQVLWLCQCDCGRQTTVAGFMQTKSCGCRLPKPPTPKPTRPGRYDHGHRGTNGSSKTPTYQSWDHMRSRCHNPKDVSYHLYGGRGVTCCERWATFKNFLADMGECPQGKTLDRINPHGNYEPGNCRWATPLEQTRNSRKNTPA